MVAPRCGRANRSSGLAHVAMREDRVEKSIAKHCVGNAIARHARGAAFFVCLFWNPEWIGSVRSIGSGRKFPRSQAWNGRLRADGLCPSARGGEHSTGVFFSFCFDREQRCRGSWRQWTPGRSIWGDPISANRELVDLQSSTTSAILAENSS
jgi:hypothetical protein